LMMLTDVPWSYLHMEYPIEFLKNIQMNNPGICEYSEKMTISAESQILNPYDVNDPIKE
jgi:hypothetical protein